MSSVRAIAQGVCVKQNKTISFLWAPFSIKMSIVLGFFNFTEDAFFFDNTKCSCSCHCWVPPNALQGGCCLLPVFYREERKSRVVGVSLELGVQQKSGSARKRMSLLSLCRGPVRQGNGNIINTERASFLSQLKWFWQIIRNSDTVFICSIPILMIVCLYHFTKECPLKKKCVR